MWPKLAAQVRRLHDQDKSGWWVPVSLVDYLGIGWMGFLMLQPGTWVPNRFADDPPHRWDGDLSE